MGLIGGLEAWGMSKFFFSCFLSFSLFSMDFRDLGAYGAGPGRGAAGKGVMFSSPLLGTIIHEKIPVDFTHPLLFLSIFSYSSFCVVSHFLFLGSFWRVRVFPAWLVSCCDTCSISFCLPLLVSPCLFFSFPFHRPHVMLSVRFMP